MSEGLHVLTANRLFDGAAVFWSGDRWIEHFPDAELFNQAEAADAILADAPWGPNELIEPYRIDVRLHDGLPAPASYRERVRALGPTIHPDLGKQAEGGPVIEAIQAAAGAARSPGRLNLIRRK